MEPISPDFFALYFLQTSILTDSKSVREYAVLIAVAPIDSVIDDGVGGVQHHGFERKDGVRSAPCNALMGRQWYYINLYRGPRSDGEMARLRHTSITTRSLKQVNRMTEWQRPKWRNCIMTSDLWYVMTKIRKPRAWTRLRRWNFACHLLIVIKMDCKCYLLVEMMTLTCCNARITSSKFVRTMYWEMYQDI